MWRQVIVSRKKNLKKRQLKQLVYQNYEVDFKNTRLLLFKEIGVNPIRKQQEIVPYLKNKLNRNFRTK